MTTSRELLEGQLERYEDKLKGLKAYVQELKSTAAAPGGVEEGHFESHLMEAEHNIDFYESGIERIKGELRNAPGPDGPRRGLGAILPPAATEGAGPFIILGVGIAVGILLGSVMSGRGDR